MNSIGGFHGEEEESGLGLGSVGTIVSVSSERSALESLPQTLLIRVIGGVDHDDLKSLKLVSKSIREAVTSLIAERIHFSYTTPEKTRPFRNSIDLENDTEPPGAPKRVRWTKAMRKEQFSSVSVTLFP